MAKKKYRCNKCGNVFEMDVNYLNNLKEIFKPGILTDPAPSLWNIIPKKKCPKCGSEKVVEYTETVNQEMEDSTLAAHDKNGKAKVKDIMDLPELSLDEISEPNDTARKDSFIELNLSKGKDYMSRAVAYFNGKIDTYKTKFNESDLMNKISSMGKKAGVTTVYYALLLYYGLMSDSIPVSKRVMVIAALGYFISPFDLIPDFILAGLLDDASVLMFAIHSILPYISEEVKDKAKIKLFDWFGEQEVLNIDAIQLSLFQNGKEEASQRNDESPEETDPVKSGEAISEKLENVESDDIAMAEEDYWESLNNDFDAAENLIDKKEYARALPILLGIYERFTVPGDYYALIEALGQEKYDSLLVWLCYNIGYCYNDQKDYVRGLYYLHQVRLSSDMRCFMEWINAIVNSSHPSALEMVEGFVNEPGDLMELWDEEDGKMVMDFLERRLGYLYIEYGRFHEARLLFTRLLSNPNSKRFAQEELDYLDRIESYNGEESNED